MLTIEIRPTALHPGHWTVECMTCNHEVARYALDHDTAVAIAFTHSTQLHRTEPMTRYYDCNEARLVLNLTKGGE